MTRYKLVIEYKGTEFAGWQKQPDALGIQTAIEEAIYRFSGQRAKIYAAGRTDAGVHACEQVAHVDFLPFKNPMTPFDIAKAINAYLRPRSVAVISAEPAAEDFHARFHALNKLYRYRILNRSACPTMETGLLWHIKKRLNVEAMQEASTFFVGHHDFTTFRASQCQAKNPVKTLHRLDVIAKPYDPYGGQDITIETEGRSFLHHQVRNMVGALVLVGEEKWKPEQIKAALSAKDRKAGGPTAPPEGLYLVRIDY